MPKRTKNPFIISYCPKLVLSLVLGPDEASYDQFLIGVMQWMIEIWCIDINTKVSLLSSNSGHLDSALHIMGYLKLRHKSRIVFDPSYPNIDHGNFWECDWTDFYEGAVEAIPLNAPLPK